MKIMNSKNKTAVRSLVLCALFTALIAVGAFIRIPIPFLPFTLQSLFINLAGLILGRKLGTASVVTYIVIGLMGIPIFTAGGGPSYIFQPSFGYLIGYAVGAWFTGLIAEKAKTKCFKTYFLACLATMASAYLFGMIYYYIIMRFYLGTPIGVKELFIFCFAIFIPTDTLKCFISALIAERLKNALKGSV